MNRFEIKAELIDKPTLRDKVFRVKLVEKTADPSAMDKLKSTAVMLIWTWNDDAILHDLRTFSEYKLMTWYKDVFKKNNEIQIERLELTYGFQQAQDMVSVINNHIDFTVLELAKQ